VLYRPVGDTGVELSVTGLGGHEYLADGSSRGFNEDFREAVKPGYEGEGYGGDARRALLAAAFESGINFFDVTIDPEQEALGRNLKEVPPPYEVYVQTRPQGMGYGYDPANRKLATYDLLEAEVVRVLGLLQRERIDFLNFPFLQPALDEDPGYLAKIAENIARLKAEGLIRFATCDTFSGEATYLAQIEAGCFDALVANFSFLDTMPERAVIPRAREHGMCVVTRELYMKGRMFRMAAEAGITDLDALTRASVKWNLSVDGVTTALVGCHTVAHLENAVAALDSPELSAEERSLLERIEQTPAGREYAASRR
jgi:aryl-alcohol dehydrogenase-like predicted oxidoreductase